MSHYDSQGRRVLSGPIDIKDATIEALRAENARLHREVDRLAEAWLAVTSEIDKLPKGADT